MSDARAELLERIVADVAVHGLGDRSLRELAAAVDSSHRMLHYHFGSRAGLVRAIVASVESGQRQLMAAAAAESVSTAELIRATWRQVSHPDARPFVRLFFEVVSLAPRDDHGPVDLTSAWLDAAAVATETIGRPFDRAGARVGIAVTRGLLIDVLTGTDVAEASSALERFLGLLPPDQPPRTKGPTAASMARRATSPS